MRSLSSFLGGAVSVGLVFAVLAFTGVIDDDSTSSSSPTQAPPSPPVATGNDDEGGGEDIASLYKPVAQGVVFTQAGQNATGSGFVYDDDGHIVTNDHVVESSTSFTVVIGSEPKPIPAQLAGRAPSSADDAHLVPNAQVVGGSTSFRVPTASEPKPIPAQLVGQDPSSDLAVLKVD